MISKKQLFQHLHKRAPSPYTKVVLRRLHHSGTNRPAVSIRHVIKNLKKRKTEKNGKSKDVAVVIGTITDDLRVRTVPGIKVCALHVTEGARARILKAGGEVLTLDQLVIQRPKGEHTVLLRGPRSHRDVAKHFGIPGRKHSHVKYVLFAFLPISVLSVLFLFISTFRSSLFASSPQHLPPLTLRFLFLHCETSAPSLH